MTEFEIIKNYFATQTRKRPDVSVGIGDDAAIVSIPQGFELVVTTDTLLESVHFKPADSPYDIGFKALAVNLSDLAAMGATPAWASLAITLKEPKENWLQAFCDGFFTLANQYHVTLIGGDLTKGPLSITVQALGYLPNKRALLRNKATPGDLIYVTGNLGDAGLALLHDQKELNLSLNDFDKVKTRLHRPQPRIREGEKLLGLAHAAIDISDGLAADLNHILEMSHVGARVDIDSLPLSPTLRRVVPREKAIDLALTAGEDYELCFTIPHDKTDELKKAFVSLTCPYTCIGEITQQQGLHLQYQNGKPYHVTTLGYQHF